MPLIRLLYPSTRSRLRNAPRLFEPTFIRSKSLTKSSASSPGVFKPNAAHPQHNRNRGFLLPRGESESNRVIRLSIIQTSSFRSFKLTSRFVPMRKIRCSKSRSAWQSVFSESANAIPLPIPLREFTGGGLLSHAGTSRTFPSFQISKW